MDTNRGGLPYLDLPISSSCVSKSLSNAGLPYKITIKPLGQLGMDANILAYGDSLTWNFLGALKIKWGTSTTLQFPTLQPNWRYEWQIGSKKLIVINDLGQVTYYPNKTTLSSLGICWDIFQSHQFTIVIDGTFEMDVFLIGTRDVERPYDLYLDLDALPGDFEGDGYPTGHPGDKDHPLIATDGENVWRTGYEQFPVWTYNSVEFLRTVLLSAITIEELKVFNDYPSQGYILPDPDNSVRIPPDRKGEIRAFDFLMIYHIANQLIMMSDPVLEPWMLYEIYTWLGQNTLTSEPDLVFELSPWWG